LKVKTYQAQPTRTFNFTPPLPSPSYGRSLRYTFILPIAFNDFCAACQNAEGVSCATAEFYRALQTYDWPGNVRELEHLILRLLAFVPDEVLEVKHLQKYFRNLLTKAVMPETEDLTLNTTIKQHIRAGVAHGQLQPKPGRQNFRPAAFNAAEQNQKTGD
jgi:DNA-binding NtrC family response regulator